MNHVFLSFPIFPQDSVLALSEISFEANRTAVVSYQYPIVYDVISFATKAPRRIPYALAIIRPFSLDVSEQPLKREN